VTLRLAVLGHPIAHSLSPRMHQAALEALGIEGCYEALDVRPDALSSAIARLRDGALDGANVTIPHKTAVVALLDGLEPDARAALAVNTIVREGPRLLGANTDVGGLSLSLAEGGVSLAGLAVVVLGAGGAARAAVLAALRGRARSVLVAARSLAKAQSLAAELGATGAISLAEHEAVRASFTGAALVVQASSATMGDGEAARTFVEGLPLEALSRDAAVTDLVYRPRETALLRAAGARGLRTIDGVGMLVHQGALSLARWTGRPIEEMPVAVMRRAVLEGSLPPT
jgi:shikimate dehydrogenase